MEMTAQLCIVVLLLTAGGGLWFLWRYAARAGGFANIGCLLLANFTVVYPISGVAHLSGIGATRGYFDLMAFPVEYTIQATIASVLAMIFIILGANRKFPEPAARGPAKTLAGPQLSSLEVRIALILLILLGPVALYGVVQMNSIAGTLQGARIITLDGGNARFNYLSQWFTWIVTFGAALLIRKRRPKDPIFVFGVLVIAILLIASALVWGGGRSIILVMTLPVILYALPRLRGMKVISVLLGVTAMLLYVVVVSDTRARSFTTGGEVNFGNWLDWEWGRFSIIGVSFEYAETYGYMFGETLVTGFLAVCVPLLNMLGLQVAMPTSATSMDIPSRILFGNYDVLYIVPGLSAELFANFGFIGIAVGYYIVGRLTFWVDASVMKSKSGLAVIMFYYFGSVLAFRTIISDSGSSLFYIVYTGAPLIMAVVLERVLTSKYFKRREQVHVTA